MTEHHYTLMHCFDILAVGVAWVSVSVTLAGVQSVATIAASLASFLYISLRIGTDPAVRGFLKKFRRN